ncbi:MAG TPA: Gfo/Idh/MocA family oxidoreductase [Spirochaetia bacterium]|nr:Gfo/Idh/MocA family oxidoreductase [Spirochaetia bacterium]
MKKLKIALLGVSHPHSPLHLRTCELMEEVEEVSLWDPDEKEAAKLAHAMPQKTNCSFRDLKELLEQRDIPVVLVTLPNRDCPEAALQALKAGKHVILEKPGAMRSGEIEPLIAAARQAGTLLSIYYAFRCHPIAQDIRKAIQEGYLGRIVDIESRLIASQVRFRDPSLWLFKKEIAGGGVLSWLGCHWIDLMRFFVGDEVEVVSSCCQRYSDAPIDVEEIANVQMRFRSGTVASLHAGYLLPIGESGYSRVYKDSYMAIYGSLGNAVWRPMDETHSFTMESVHPDFLHKPRSRHTYELPDCGAYNGIVGLEFLRRFIKAAQTGGVPPADGTDALRTLEVIEAAYRSDETKAHVRI